MATALAKLQRFAATDETIVLLGETGTGKTHLARWLHQQSRRQHRDFYARNLAGLDDSLASSELFGHVPGAFTDAKQGRPGLFASASGGTVLLDEIGKTSLTVQRKLLDVIERRAFTPLGTNREVRLNARLVFAASESLEALAAAGVMLADLLPRLGLFQVRVPPLREHCEDIPVLMESMIAHYAARFGYAPGDAPRPTAELLQVLMDYDWPHNIRELDSLVLRLLAEAPADRLDVSLLRDELARYNPRATPVRRKRPSVEDLRDALSRAGGQRKAAAKLLGIGRTSLYRLMHAESRDPGTDEQSRTA